MHARAQQYHYMYRSERMPSDAVSQTDGRTDGQDDVHRFWLLDLRKMTASNAGGVGSNEEGGQNSSEQIINFFQIVAHGRRVFCAVCCELRVSVTRLLGLVSRKL